MRMWKPRGACRVDGLPVPGALVAEDHCVWRVTMVSELHPAVDWPGARTHLVTLDPLTGSRARYSVETTRYSAWWTYPGRYPLCSCCSEPPPCRAELLEQSVQRELAAMRRFDAVDTCPACQIAVTPGQPAVTFPDNIQVPLGPPVTFHLTLRRCLRAAIDYERRWLAAGTHRRPLVVCQGTLHREHGGMWRCTAGPECLGHDTTHAVTVRNDTVHRSGDADDQHR